VDDQPDVGEPTASVQGQLDDAEAQPLDQRPDLRLDLFFQVRDHGPTCRFSAGEKKESFSDSFYLQAQRM
jgi:hypothetical protein